MMEQKIKKYLYSKKHKTFSLNPAWQQAPGNDSENAVNAEFKEMN